MMKKWLIPVGIIVLLVVMLISGYNNLVKISENYKKIKYGKLYKMKNNDFKKCGKGPMSLSSFFHQILTTGKIKWILTENLA